MSDLSVNTAQVHIHSQTTRLLTVEFGETMTPGQSTFMLGSDQKYYKAIASSETNSRASGVVLVGASTNTYGVIVENGPMDLGATLIVGVPYVVSNTAGGIAPAADFASYSNTFLTHLGYATAADTIDIRPFVTGAEN